jgi:hypothetical protein
VTPREPLVVLARESNWVRTTSLGGAFVGTGGGVADAAFELRGRPG